jgi:uncharacterized protein with HEPN domain
MSKDKESVLDIIEAVKKILAYTAGVTLTEFQANDEKQDAVLRRILVIGEATKRLSPEFRQLYPDIPWRDIAGIRDIIVHDYNRVDVERVWDVVQNDLPDLLTFLTSLDKYRLHLYPRRSQSGGPGNGADGRARVLLPRAGGGVGRKAKANPDSPRDYGEKPQSTAPVSGSRRVGGRTCLSLGPPLPPWERGWG